MNTMLLHTEFKNDSKMDIGPMYYNSRNTLVTHSVFSGAFIYQSSFSHASLPAGKLTCVEEVVNYSMSKSISLGAGLKYNYSSFEGLARIGFNVQGQFRLKGVGVVQMMVDKSFIPTFQQILRENYIARVVYQKTF